MPLSDLFGKMQSGGFRDTFKGGGGPPQPTDGFADPNFSPPPQSDMFSLKTNMQKPYAPPPTPPMSTGGGGTNVPLNANNPSIQQQPPGMQPMPFNMQQLQQILARANPMLLRYLMTLNKGRL